MADDAEQILAVAPTMILVPAHLASGKEHQGLPQNLWAELRFS